MYSFRLFLCLTHAHSLLSGAPVPTSYAHQTLKRFPCKGRDSHKPARPLELPTDCRFMHSIVILLHSADMTSLATSYHKNIVQLIHVGLTIDPFFMCFSKKLWDDKNKNETTRTSQWCTHTGHVVLPTGSLADSDIYKCRVGRIAGYG